MAGWMLSFPFRCICANVCGAVITSRSTSPAGLRKASECRWMSAACVVTGTISQALKEHRQRWENVRGIFSVRRPERLRGKHILLVDDVLTTGATITSCAEAILAAVPDVRISIAVLAVSRHNLEAA